MGWLKNLGYWGLWNIANSFRTGALRTTGLNFTYKT